VLIKEDNTPFLQWPLGRIIKTIHGKDNFVRVFILLNVDALRAVQTSGPNDTKHVLVTRGPILISGKYCSRGRYIEQIKTGQNIDQQD